MTVAGVNDAMMRTTAMLVLALAMAACGGEGKQLGDKDFECQATCMDAEGNRTEGFDSYTISDVVDEEQAIDECFEMAEANVVEACGEGRSLAGSCVCAPRSPG